MAEEYGFYDPRLLPDGTYDREYNAKSFSVPFNALINTGVMRSTMNELTVTSDGLGMITKIDTGIAFINGRYYKNTSFKTHQHDTESLGVSRIDRIVIRMNEETDHRSTLSYVKKGVASANPVPPTLVQTESIYEISLAQVKIVGGQTFIAPNAVTSERGTEGICPWAGSNILPSFDDNLLAQHVENKEVHVQTGERNNWNGKVNRAGDTMNGDLIIEKGIPRIILRPTLSPADTSKRLDIFYNANAANNFGVAVNKDGKGVMIINSESDVQFWHPTDGWFSLQGLKTSLGSGKSGIASTLTEKGQATSPTAEFATMIANIRKLFGYASGSAVVASKGAISVNTMTFQPKLVVARCLENNAKVYAEKLTGGDGYTLRIQDGAVPDGVIGGDVTGTYISKQTRLAFNTNGFYLPIWDAGTYVWHAVG